MNITNIYINHCNIYTYKILLFYKNEALFDNGIFLNLSGLSILIKRKLGNPTNILIVRLTNSLLFFNIITSNFLQLLNALLLIKLILLLFKLM